MSDHNVHKHLPTEEERENLQRDTKINRQTLKWLMFTYRAIHENQF